MALSERITELFSSGESELQPQITVPAPDRTPVISEGLTLEEIRKAELGKQYAERVRDLVRAQMGVVSAVGSGTDASIIKRMVGSSQRELQTSEQETELLEDTADTLLERRRQLERAYRRYPDDKKLFEAVAGFPPSGKVKIDREPLMVFIKPSRIRDYAALSLHKSQDALKPMDIRYARSTGGCAGIYSENKGFSGHIAALNPGNSGNSEQLVKGHERLHIYNRLLKKDAPNVVEESSWSLIKRAQNEGNPELVAVGLEGYLTQQFKRVRFEAADEIRAFTLDGNNTHQTKEILLRSKDDGGLYDYFSQDRYLAVHLYEHTLTKGLKGEYESELDQAMARYYSRERLHAEIEAGLDAVELLKQRGISPAEINQLLQNVELDKWPKISRRLAEHNAFPRQIMSVDPGDKVVSVLEGGEVWVGRVSNVRSGTDYVLEAEDGHFEAMDASFITQFNYPFKKPSAWASLVGRIENVDISSEDLGFDQFDAETISSLHIWPSIKERLKLEGKSPSETTRQVFRTYRQFLRKTYP